MKALAFIAALAAALSLCGGCTTTRISPDSAPQAAIDPCSARLQDIGGTILMYYALNKHLPLTLTDAASLGDIDTPADLSCPVSKLPYIYNPQGLAIPGTNRRIIVYDATPVHDGARRCLIMTPPVRGRAVTCDVQSFPENVFQTLKPAH